MMRNVLSYQGAWSDEPRLGMQGQTFTRVLGADNAPGSPLCQVEILMAPGKVSTPHVHRRTHVYVHVKSSGPQGALTLWVERLEHEEWTFPDQTLWIPPGVPHVAVYVRYFDAPSLRALETRTTPDPDEDVEPLPTLWPLVGRRLEALDLTELVDLPVDAR